MWRASPVVGNRRPGTKRSIVAWPPARLAPGAVRSSRHDVRGNRFDDGTPPWSAHRQGAGPRRSTDEESRHVHSEKLREDRRPLWFGHAAADRRLSRRRHGADRRLNVTVETPPEPLTAPVARRPRSECDQAAALDGEEIADRVGDGAGRLER